VALEVPPETRLNVRRLAWIGFCLLLFYPSAFAGTKEGEPDKEMLRLMELLREWEMLKNLDLVRDLEKVERAGELSPEPSAQKSQQKTTKEKK